MYDNLLLVFAEVCFECLQVVRDIIPVLGNGSTSKILSAVSPLLISVGLDMRLFICDLLAALAQTDPSVLVVVVLLFDYFSYGYCFERNFFDFRILYNF